MMKKLIFVLMISVFAVFSVNAQKNVDSFLGTWKLVKKEGYLKSSSVKSVVLNVSKTDGKLNIERTTEGTYQNKDYSNAQTTNYNLNGTTSTSLVGGQFGGVYQNQMDFLAENKLRLTYRLQRDSAKLNSIEPGTSEYWTLSDNGKTLTIEILTGSNSSKLIFSK